MSRPEHNPLETRAIDAGQDAVASRAKTDRDIADDDLRWLMNAKQGRRVVWAMLARTGVFQTSMTGNSYTFFNEGARNVGLYLMAEVNRLVPELYAKMVKESKDAE